LTSSYYEKWFLRNQQLLIERGLIDADEVAAGRALRPVKSMKRGRFTLADVERSRGAAPTGDWRQAHVPSRRPRAAKHIHPTTQTRVPRYARGHVGGVERLHGAHIFPDSVVAGKGEDPQWLYTVRFDAQELWGADADPTLKVSIEAFEPYLEHV
jgi:nitrile hydratase